MNFDNYDIFLSKFLNRKSIELDLEKTGHYSNIENKTLGAYLDLMQENINKSLDFMVYKGKNRSWGGNWHFNADDSRELIDLIESSNELITESKKFGVNISISDEYLEFFNKAIKILQHKGGTQIPDDFSIIERKYYEAIYFVEKLTSKDTNYDKQLIGQGSYADVYKYTDKVHGNTFVVKKLKRDSTDDDKNKLKIEFQEISKLNSPYVVKVFKMINEDSYTMEYMEMTLYDYIKKVNTKITILERRKLILQFTTAMKYIHSKNILHRDLAFKNVLISKYDDVVTMKISDFGLVKIKDQDNTNTKTLIKGTLIDPLVQNIGYKNYSITNEIYSVGRIIYYIMTGRENTNKYDCERLKKIIEKCTTMVETSRYKSVAEIEIDLNNYFSSIKN